MTRIVFLLKHSHPSALDILVDVLGTVAFQIGTVSCKGRNRDGTMPLEADVAQNSEGAVLLRQTLLANGFEIVSEEEV